MNIPVSFKINSIRDTKTIPLWIESNDMHDRVTYDWITRVITFSDEDDITAFMLVFGANRYNRKIDEMIKNETD